MSDGYSEEMLALILERSKILNRIGVIESELDSHPPVPARLGDDILYLTAEALLKKRDSK